MRLFDLPRAALLAAALLIGPGVAGAADPRVDMLGDGFVAALPVDWTRTRGSWEFLDVADCYTNGKSCFGNNPSSPYGYPMFGAAPRFLMGASEALVVFMRTPPEVRYFALTQYLISRGINVEPVLASLSDSLNTHGFLTLGSPGPGQNLFNQYAVIVWAADLNTLASIKTVLSGLGIPGAQVNFLPIPISLPLNMGYAVNADSFSLLLRTAMPVVQADLDKYRADLPFYVVKVGPGSPPPISPAPTIGYASEVSGFAESSDMEAALGSLIADIKSNYKRSFVVKEQIVVPYLAEGLDCIAGISTCMLDNHDALYSSDITGTTITVSNVRDLVIVAGVNHHNTGKALYLNQTINDPIKSTGIASVDDKSFTTQSALFHGGVKLLGDPRVKLYKDLYAYAISYDCNGLKYCLNIPAPTPDKPVGLPPGAPFSLWERSYVEPHTGVRPATTEVVRQRVLVGAVR